MSYLSLWWINWSKLTNPKRQRNSPWICGKRNVLDLCDIFILGVITCMMTTRHHVNQHHWVVSMAYYSIWLLIYFFNISIIFGRQLSHQMTRVSVALCISFVLKYGNRTHVSLFRDCHRAIPRPRNQLGPASVWKCGLAGIGIPIIKISRFRDLLIFIKEIPYVCNGGPFWQAISSYVRFFSITILP